MMNVAKESMMLSRDWSIGTRTVVFEHTRSLRETAVNNRFISVVGNGIAGAGLGGLYAWSGASILARCGHAAYVGLASPAGIAGVVGGAVMQGGIALLATIDGSTTTAAWAASPLVPALAGAPIGSLILTAAGHLGQIDPVLGLAAGCTGMGAVAGVAVAGAGVLACCCLPVFAGVVAGLS